MFAHRKPHKPKVREWEAGRMGSSGSSYVEQIWKEMLETANVDLFEAMSGGSQGFKRLAWINEDGTETRA